MSILETEENAVYFMGELELIPHHDRIIKHCNCSNLIVCWSCP